VQSLGAIPFPIDNDGVSNFSLSHLHKTGARFKAVIPVHWPGITFSLMDLANYCTQTKTGMVVDACQSFPESAIVPAWCGVFKLAVAFSFQQNKQITCGEGGCVCTNDEALASDIRAAVDHGIQRDRSEIASASNIGRYTENCKITGLQAAMLEAQLMKMPSLLSRQAENRAAALRMINNGALERSETFAMLSRKDDLGRGLFFLATNTAKSTSLTIALAQKRILAKLVWPIFFPDLQFFENRLRKADLYDEVSLNSARQLSFNLLFVPMPPLLTIAETTYICNCLFEISDGLKSVVP
jgi:dTDP-4-amino-4,6-dideoxygalactose transaminase